MLRTHQTPITRATATFAALLCTVSLVIGQTKITAPKNKYKPAEDVKLGLDAARQVEEQMPLLRDSQVGSYVEGLGDRLVASIPSEFRHPEFRYTFKVVNLRDINAFALPGGPMYVNRGMIEAAKTEGEVAGVMAHELSHVVLRHGTAQASKATPYEIGSIAGQILGAIIGGTAGAVVSQGAQFGFGTAFLRFSREYEKQADILGSQIMARTGYDPRDMANLFKTIEQQSGSGGPQFMSDHPSPGNRTQYINAEAQMLSVENPVHDTRAFADVRARLQRMPQAPTTEEVMKEGNKRTSSSGYPADAQIGNVQPPSTRFKTFEEGGLFRISVPSNWQELPANSTVTFAPEGGYGNYQGQSVFTHGVEVGIQRNDSGDLRTATAALVDSLRQGNPQLRGGGSYTSVTIAGRRGLRTLLGNVSDVTRQEERIELSTTLLADGSLFYVIGVAPTQEFARYQRVFSQVVQSIRLTDNQQSSR